MIVYGDAKISVRLAHVISKLIEPASSDLDSLRTKLIIAGQLEQALEDQSSEQAVIARRLTDHFANLFVSAYLGSRTGKSGTEHLFAQFDPTTRLEAKVPEGYQCYRLYPEQYIEATLQVLEQEPFEISHVVGIRTIGTSLSAVVAETLRVHGKAATRQTARPTGDPYNRQVSETEAVKADLVLVVDEGPGQSGSSFAAVYRAVNATSQARVVFLPGHAGEPGSSASDETRRIWTDTKRYVHDYTAGVEERLRSATAELLKSNCETIELTSTDRWPLPCDSPSYAPFEQPKYLASSGDQRLLWIFYGLESWDAGASREWLHLEKLYQNRFGPPPLGKPVLGFVAVKIEPWKPIGQINLEEFIDYLKASSLTEFVNFEPDEAFGRLSHMAYWNVQKTLGSESAQRLRSLTPAGPPAGAVGLFGEPARASYCDGRLHLSNWVRTVDGQLIKLDAAGHTRDNTIVGLQHILWDIAGAVVELGLNSDDLLRRTKLGAVSSHFPFYQLAYLAFWAGMARMSADILGPQDHRTPRLEAEFNRYRAALQQALLPQLSPCRDDEEPTQMPS
jgi:hypothetical protein